MRRCGGTQWQRSQVLWRVLILGKVCLLPDAKVNIRLGLRGLCDVTAGRLREEWIISGGVCCQRDVISPCYRVTIRRVELMRY